MTVATFPLTDEEARAQATRYLASAPIGKGLEVVIRPERRSDKQNRRYWSMINSLVKSEHKGIAGRSWDAEGWHRIMLSLYWTEKRQEAPTVIAGAAGEFLSMHHSSRELSKEEFGDLMASTLAYIDQNGITWAERAQYPEDR